MNPSYTLTLLLTDIIYLSKMMNNTKFAFDLGGVILHREALENFIVDESDISVKLTVQKFSAENVYIISKAKDKYIERNL